MSSKRISLPQNNDCIYALTPSSFLQAARTLAETDQALGVIVDRYDIPPLWHRPPEFVTLIQIVLEQHVSLESARAVFNRLQKTIDPLTPTRLAAAHPDVLGRVGLTRQKQNYCQNIARAIVSGELQLSQLAKLPDHHVRAELTRINGIGLWTADVYLLMALRRRDVFPVRDIALITAVADFITNGVRPDLAALKKIAHPWQPWRAVATRLLWHGYLSKRRRNVFDH